MDRRADELWRPRRQLWLPERELERPRLFRPNLPLLVAKKPAAAGGGSSVRNFYASAFETDTAGTISAVSWQANDVVVVAYVMGHALNEPNTPTGTGLSFIASQSQDSGGGSDCDVTFFKATPGSAGTSINISVGRSAGDSGWKAFCWVVDGTDVVDGFANLNESATNLTVAAGATVLFAAAEWNAGDTDRGMTTGSGTKTVREDDANTSHVKWVVGDWQNVSAGTFAFGCAGYGTSLIWSQCAVEVSQ